MPTQDKSPNSRFKCLREVMLISRDKTVKFSGVELSPVILVINTTSVDTTPSFIIGLDRNQLKTNRPRRNPLHVHYLMKM